MISRAVYTILAYHDTSLVEVAHHQHASKGATATALLCWSAKHLTRQDDVAFCDRFQEQHRGEKQARTSIAVILTSEADLALLALRDQRRRPAIAIANAAVLLADPASAAHQLKPWLIDFLPPPSRALQWPALSSGTEPASGRDITFDLGHRLTGKLRDLAEAWGMPASQAAKLLLSTHLCLHSALTPALIEAGRRAAQAAPPAEDSETITIAGAGA